MSLQKRYTKIYREQIKDLLDVDPQKFHRELRHYRGAKQRTKQAISKRRTSQSRAGSLLKKYGK